MKLFYFLILVAGLTSAQCDLGTTGIGDFEDSGDFGTWFASGQGQGSVTEETSEVYMGSKSVKAVADVFSSWQVRIKTNICDISLTAGKTYSCSFWLKGTNGNQFSVTLEEDVNHSANFNVDGNGWKQYKHSFVATTNFNTAALRINFISAGTYFIDNITFQEADCNGEVGGSATLDGCSICAGGSTGITPDELCDKDTIKPNSPKLEYNGTLREDLSDVAGDLYRFKKTYTDALGTGKALTQSCISISFQTDAPLIEFEFEELPGAEIRARNFAIYKDGKLYQDGIGDLEFEFQNLNKTLSHWEVVLPSFSGVRFLRMIHTKGYSVSAVSNTKPIYLAIGNSITHGVGQTDYGSHLTYPFLVADSLDYQVYNLGVGGSKINSSISDNLDALPRAPHVISVLWGYNDCMFPWTDISTPLADYEVLIETLASTYPDATILPILQTFTNSTAGTNPANTISRLRSETDDIITSLQGTYSNICKMDGSNYTDASSIMDDVHLNNNGARSLANGIISELTSCGLFVSTEQQKPHTIAIINQGSQLIAKSEAALLKFELYNLSGQKIAYTNSNAIDISKINEGIYIARIIQIDGKPYSSIIKK